EAAPMYLLSLLPTEFNDCEAIWQLTSSAGIKPGIRMRLWFWLTEPRTIAEMKLWLDPVLAFPSKRDDPKRIVDYATFTPSQPIYAAAPVIANGAEDPVVALGGKRLGMLLGAHH